MPTLPKVNIYVFLLLGLTPTYWFAEQKEALVESGQVTPDQVPGELVPHSRCTEGPLQSCQFCEAPPGTQSNSCPSRWLAPVGSLLSGQHHKQPLEVFVEVLLIALQNHLLISPVRTG